MWIYLSQRLQTIDSQLKKSTIGNFEWLNSNAEAMKKEKIEAEKSREISRSASISGINLRNSLQHASQRLGAIMKILHTSEENFSFTSTLSEKFSHVSSHFPMLLNMAFHTSEKLSVNVRPLNL